MIGVQNTPNVRITNKGSEDFKFSWDSVEYVIPAGKSILGADWIVAHLWGSPSRLAHPSSSIANKEKEWVANRWGNSTDNLSWEPYTQDAMFGVEDAEEPAPAKRGPGRPKKEVKEPEFEGSDIV